MLHVPFISKVEFSSYLIVVLKRGAKTTRQCVDNLQISDTLYAVDFKISCCNKKSYDNTYEKKMWCFLFIWCLLMWMYINVTLGNFFIDVSIYLYCIELFWYNIHADKIIIQNQIGINTSTNIRYKVISHYVTHKKTHHRFDWY